MSNRKNAYAEVYTIDVYKRQDSDLQYKINYGYG